MSDMYRRRSCPGRADVLLRRAGGGWSGWQRGLGRYHLCVVVQHGGGAGACRIVGVRGWRAEAGRWPLLHDDSASACARGGASGRGAQNTLHFRRLRCLLRHHDGASSLPCATPRDRGMSAAIYPVQKSHNSHAQ